MLCRRGQARLLARGARTLRTRRTNFLHGLFVARSGKLGEPIHDILPGIEVGRLIVLRRSEIWVKEASSNWVPSSRFCIFCTAQCAHCAL